jgi:hypothetical protein
LLFGVGHLAPVRGLDIANAIFRVDVMVAAKEKWLSKFEQALKWKICYQ